MFQIRIVRLDFTVIKQYGKANERERRNKISLVIVIIHFRAELRKNLDIYRRSLANPSYSCLGGTARKLQDRFSGFTALSGIVETTTTQHFIVLPKESIYCFMFRSKNEEDTSVVRIWMGFR